MSEKQGRPRIAKLVTVWVLASCCLPALQGSAGAQAVKLRMSEAEAVQLLASDDLGERDRALRTALDLGDRAGPELRAAVIRAAWEEARGETVRHPESEVIGDYIEAVAGFRDPAAIPFLLEHGAPLTSVTNDLADFGELAFTAVLQKAKDRRTGFQYQHGASNAIDVLRFMVEDGWVDPDRLAKVRQVVRMRLTEPGQVMGAICYAATLAVVLGAPELVAVVERLASDRSAVVALLADNHRSESTVLYVQRWARDRLAGVPLEGGFVRRRPKSR